MGWECFKLLVSDFQGPFSTFDFSFSARFGI